MNLANEKADCSTNSKKYPENDIEQRSSLPDIPLSNREKADLENSMLMQNSHSSESVLQGIVPPPKPSKDRKPNAPPLPPKKKPTLTEENQDDIDSMQIFSNSDLKFNRRIDFNNFDDNQIEINERGKSFSSIEKCILSARSINETESSKPMTSSQMQDFNEQNLSSSSIDVKVCKIKISQEMNFHSVSSNVEEMNNRFNFMSMNQSDLRVDQKLRSNENFSLLNALEEQPPPLPIKTRSRSLRMEHNKSVYDNVENMNRNSLDTKASTTSSNSSLTSTLSTRTENAMEFSSLKVNY